MACLFLSGGSTATQVLPTIETGPGPFVLDDPQAGLANLSSYTATLNVSFDGTRAGQSYQWSTSRVMIVGREPAARQFTMRPEGHGGPPLFMAEVEGVSYDWSGEGPCTAAIIVPGLGLADHYEPADLLSAVVGADEAGSETVDGVAANHYTFDARALGRSAFTTSTGEVWVAVDGGYIAKYLLTTQAGPEFFGPDTEGTFRLDYGLTDLDQPVEVQVPEDCPAGLVDAPQLPDAVNVVSLPGLLTYDSAASVDEAEAFYRDGLPGLGWQASSEPLVTETSALLDFSQGHETLTIVITLERTHTVIRIYQIR